MGHQQVEQAALFYGFSLDKSIPADHLLRSIDMASLLRPSSTATHGVSPLIRSSAACRREAGSR